MERPMFTAIAIALLLLCRSAFAQTQLELNDQARASFDKADARLNETYNQLKAKLDDEGRKKLQEAERAWIKFRDAEADSQADAYRGGSILPKIYDDCLAKLTNARTAELADRIKDLDNP